MRNCCTILYAGAITAPIPGNFLLIAVLLILDVNEDKVLPKIEGSLYGILYTSVP